MKEITLKNFLYHFCENIRVDKKFCFILGSGASKSSGIPTGAELVKEWMAELSEMHGPDVLDSWKEKEGISMDDLAKDYSKIFDKRFEIDKKDGFAFLEQKMEGKEPRCGYSVLAQILDTKQHKIVITTNFDSLTEDALFIYTQKKPLVVGHEALANYIKPFGSRPIIVKIHRDLFLTPKNTANETHELETNFKKYLTGIFQYYTPIIIGYGGNDGSLMGFLEDLDEDEIEGGIFWFYRKKDGGLNKRIIALIEKFKGCAIPIPGFDDLMIQIGNKLGLDQRLDEKIVEIANQRAKNYREQIKELNREKTTSKETREAVSSMVSKGIKDWLYYEIEASKEEDIAKRDKIYQEGIKCLPTSAELHCNYASYLYKLRKEYDKAEGLYERAIKLYPDGATTIGNYASFLYEIRKEYDKAEGLYERAIKLYPDGATTIGNYASFLYEIRKEYDKAEELYKKAIELDPNHAYNIGSYALLLEEIRKKHDKAEELYKKAIELDPNDANNIGNYAKHQIVKREIKNAGSLIQKAFELNQDEREDLSLELWFYCYAIFFDEYKDAKDNIEALLKKGTKSTGWYLDDVLAAAKELGHPDYKNLCELEKRITAI